MRKIWWLVGIMALGLACVAASAQNSAIQGYCQNGGVKVSVSGTLSTNTVQASYPKCIVTVFLTGTTTPATIYSNATGTPLSNPFTANTNGLWLFYAATGSGYDVTLTGGTPIAMPFPVTLTDIVIGGGGSGGVISINGTPGAYTFTGSGVSCVGTTCTFTSGGGGFTAGGDLAGSSSSQQVIGLKTVPFCTGYTPTNGQFVQLTTASSPNPCYTATTASGGVSSVSGAAGNRGASVSPTTGAVVITTFDQELFASQFSTIPALASACGSAATKITVDTAQSFTLAGSATFPPNCAFNFVQGGVWTTGGAFALTFNGTVDGNASQHFAGAATVKFGTLVTSVPVEWFGGKNDATGSTGVGTNNLAAFNAAVASLNAGQVTMMPSLGSTGYYRITGPIAIAVPNVGIEGSGAGTNGPTILIDSASADAIDVNPGSSWNVFRNFNIYRTQLATGTAAGLAIYGTSRPAGIVVDGIISADSVNDFYMEGLTQFGPGNFVNNQANWQMNGLVGSSPSGACGFLVDSSTFGAGFETQLSGPNSAITGGSGIGQTGFCDKGNNLSEVTISNFTIGGLDYGMDFEDTGTNNYIGQSIHINNAILAPCNIACIKINNIETATDIGPHVYIQGGLVFTSAIGVLVQNSSNISISGMQFLSATTGSAAATDIALSSADGFNVNDNQFTGGSLFNVSCLNSSHGTINDNIIKSENGFSTSTGIKMVGCTQTTIQSNTISGVVSGGLLTGISFDSGSSNNGPWSLNQIDTATVTTPVTDAGTNNNPSLVAGANITITGSWPNQTIAAAASGTGISGATIGQALIAGSATTATSSKPLAGSGAGLTTGPTSGVTPGDLALFTGTGGQITDGAIAGSDVARLSTTQTFSGAKTFSLPVIGTLPSSSAQGAFAVGTLPYSDTGIGSSIAANTNSYVQSVVSNANAGTAASADFIVSNDQGTATTNYGDLGINSSAFSGSGNLTGLASETYVYANGGPLGIGTLTNNPVHLVVNNNGTDSITLNTGGTVSVPSLNSGGMVKSIVSTGLLSIAVPGTDYQIPIVCGTLNSFIYQGSSSPVCAADVKEGGSGGLVVITTSTATSGANFNSPLIESAGSFWTGTAGATDDWTMIDTLGAGTNPTSTLTFAHAGSSGVAKVAVPAFAVTSQTGSTQCASFDTNGNLTGTGSACGAGGSTTWNGISNPTGNQSLAMGNFTTTWTFGAATGSTTPMVTMTDTASNTGTGPVARFATAASSQGFPAQFLQRGTALLTVGATGGGTGSIFSGTLAVNKTSNVNGDGLEVQGGIYVTSGASTFQSSVSGSSGFELAMYNSNQTSGTGSGIQFDGQNTGFSPAQIANIAGVMTAGAGASFLTGKIVFSTANNAAPVAVADISALGDFDLLLGHLTFAQTTPPVASSCGGGTVAAGGTDNSFAVTGITAATGCTITFNRAIKQGICTAGTSTGIASGPSSISTSAVTFTMAALTGTLYANCW